MLPEIFMTILQEIMNFFPKTLKNTFVIVLFTDIIYKNRANLIYRKFIYLI